MGLKALLHIVSNMKRIFFLSFFIILFHFVSRGQQDPQFTNYMFYKLGINPAFAGAEGAVNGMMLNRYQWEGMKGAPKTQVFSGDASINKFGFPGGIGVNFIRDEIGYAKNTLVNLNFAYRKPLKSGDLAIGVSTGIFNMSINGEWSIPEDENFGIFVPPSSDPLIPQSEVSQSAFDLGFGLYYSTNRYHLGASVSHLNQGVIKYGELATTFLARHYYLQGGYNIKLRDPLFELRPSFMFKTDLAGWMFDANVNLFYNDKMWAGISYRYQDAVILLMGIELVNGLKVGYSFDAVTSAINYYGWGSHELFISYSIDLEKNRNQKYKSVRFL